MRYFLRIIGMLPIIVLTSSCSEAPTDINRRLSLASYDEIQVWAVAYYEGGGFVQQPSCTETWSWKWIDFGVVPPQFKYEKVPSICESPSTIPEDAGQVDTWISNNDETEFLMSIPADYTEMANVIDIASGEHVQMTAVDYGGSCVFKHWVMEGPSNTTSTSKTIFHNGGDGNFNYTAYFECAN